MFRAMVYDIHRDTGTRGLALMTAAGNRLHACGGVHHPPGAADAQDALRQLGQHASHGDEAVLLLLHRSHLHSRPPGNHQGRENIINISALLGNWAGVEKSGIDRLPTEKLIFGSHLPRK